MSNYKHGIATGRTATTLTIPISTDGCLQAVVGTAPVNLAANPYNTTNQPFVAYSKTDAVKAVGYNTDFKNYTLCQSIYATFDVFGTAPLVLINVLDPKKHVTAELSKEVQILARKGLIEEEGILLDKLKITDAEGSTTYKPGEDYVASFDSSGHVVLAMTKGGDAASAVKVKVTFAKIDPEAVTYEDIIGGYDTATQTKTGMELFSSIYPKFGLIPGLLLAPGWTKVPAVNIALNAKCENIYSMFTAKVVSDLDSAKGKAESAEEVRTVKNENGYSDRTTYLCWPLVKVGDYVYSMSAQLAALMQYQASQNSGVPSKSPSNKNFKISGICNEEGTEIEIDMDSANDYCNAAGVITAINMNGWKCWGNNTAAYPSSTDPIDRWINVVAIFDYIENKFKATFFQKVDDLTNYRLIDDIVDTENLSLNGLQGSDDIAGGTIVFDHEENPITQIMNGHIKFHERIGGYTPAEYIENIFEFDPTITQAALEGGSE